METTRRGFLGAAAAAGAATGWLLFGKGASADEKSQGNRILREWDETLDGGIEARLIEMRLTYDNPFMQFDVPAPDKIEPLPVAEVAEEAIERQTHRRLTVARHTATQIQKYDQNDDLWAVVRRRAATMGKFRGPNPSRLANPPSMSRYSGNHVVVIVCHCPSGTEVGMLGFNQKLTSADMHLTIPATLLPKGA